MLFCSLASPNSVGQGEKPTVMGRLSDQGRIGRITDQMAGTQAADDDPAFGEEVVGGDAYLQIT